MTRIDFHARMPIIQWSQVTSHLTVTVNPQAWILPRVWSYVVALG